MTSVRNDEIWIQNEEFWIQNEEFWIQNEDICIKNEELCIKQCVGGPTHCLIYSAIWHYSHVYHCGLLARYYAAIWHGIIYQKR